jgi:hypothetical protein
MVKIPGIHQFTESCRTAFLLQMHAHHPLPKKQTQGLLGRRTVSKETAQQIQIENPKVKVEQPLRTVTNAEREKPRNPDRPNGSSMGSRFHYTTDSMNSKSYYSRLRNLGRGRFFFCFQPFWAEQLPRLQFLSDCLGTYLILLALKIRSQWSS